MKQSLLVRNGDHAGTTGVSRRVPFTSLALAVLGVCLAGNARAQQSAFIADAWWTFQQDCNGDGSKAGTLPGDLARLNWEPDVINCNGSLVVFEVVSLRSCGDVNWTPVYTNAPHAITGCRSIDQQTVDLPMGPTGTCRDYSIDVYRLGQNTPDDTRSSANDPDLSQHHEQLLSQDFCLSDFFATCVSLSGAAGSANDNNINATKEPGEPDHAGNSGGHSLWYCWSTTNNAPVTFDTLGSTFDTLLAVYTGNTVSNLALVASNDDIAGATNRMSRVSFTPVPGAEYHIAVDGYGGAAGNVTLNFSQGTAALPDLIVWGAAASPSVLTRDFATNDCEVVEGCAIPGLRRLLTFTMETRNIGSGDLYVGNPATSPLFIWATCHGHWHFEQFAEYNLLDTNANIVATGHKVGFCLEDVHSIGAPGSPTSAKYNCNNQGIQHGWADVYPAGLACQYIDITDVVPGDYVLQMIVNPDGIITESRSDNNMALVPVSIPPLDACPTAPDNDAFTNARVVLGTPYSSTEFNNCATKESGEPDIAGNAGGHSVWWVWTPTSNHVATVTTKRSDFDTLLGVYTGNSVDSLTMIATNDDIVAGIYVQSSLSFPAVAGTTYYIGVDGWGGAVGTVFLNVDPAGNDDFVNAYTLAGMSGTTNASTLGTSKEPYEPAHASDVGGHSIWYVWTAPASGPVDFNTAGSTFDTTLAVYTGNIVTNLNVIASNDDDAEVGGLLTSRLWFYAQAGTKYKIAVDGFGGVYGNVLLNWSMGSSLHITPLPDGSARVTMSGVDWHRYTLLGSPDLVSWGTEAPPITMSGGLHVWTNWPATNTSASKFFQGIRTP